MKAVICGGRSYDLTTDDLRWLDALHEEHHFTTVLSGGARGADAWGETWAKLNAIPVERHPPDWSRWGNAAGPIRNAEMANVADAVVAFAGGRGTADMIRRAQEKGLPVFRRE